MINRFRLIDNLYTYGMILVVAGHIGLNENFSQTYLYKWIYGFHMPLFFWIAGFLFGNSGEMSFSKFAVKKAKRLLVPLFVLTSLVFFPKSILSQYAMRPTDGSFIDYLLVFVYPDRNPIQPLWFLNALFGVYILGWICSRLCAGKTYWWLAAIVVAYAFNHLLPTIDIFYISIISYYFPYFCIGFIVRKRLPSIIGFIERSKIGTYPIMLSAVLTSVYSFVVLFPVNGYILALLGLSAAISLILCFESSDISFFPQLRPYTFTIYLLQWFPMVAVRIICYNYLQLNPYICYSLMFVSGLFVPLLIGKIAVRILPDKGIVRYVLLSIGL